MILLSKKIMHPFRLSFVLFLSSLLFSCSSLQMISKNKPRNKTVKVILGNENFIQKFLTLIKGKRVGLVTNPSGVDSKLHSTADVFFKNPGINLVALFGPEHGIRGAIYAGEHVSKAKDAHTGLPVFSLYGRHRQPTKQMSDSIDVFIIDIQDIGIRAYTYIYTMAEVLKAAAKYNKEVIVLDRPNPINGRAIEGNLVEKGFFSFVGLYPIPYRHGMTIGELALLFNNEFKIHAKLKVIPMKNWRRDMFWSDTHLPWVPTSPHVPHWMTILYMGSTGTFGELHTLSEGVGYTSPFEMVGAPWIDGYQLAAALNKLQLPGVLFRPLYFHPYYASFKDQICQGVQLHITDPKAYHSYNTGLYIMQTVMDLYPQHTLFADSNRVKMFNKVMGCDWITKDLKNHIPVEDIESKWQEELQAFKKIRQKYLLY